jgi:hypothetical protein
MPYWLLRRCGQFEADFPQILSIGGAEARVRDPAQLLTESLIKNRLSAVSRQKMPGSFNLR